MKNNSLVIFTINDVWYDQRMIKIASALQNSGFDVLWVARARQKESFRNDYDFSIKRWKFICKKGPLLYAEYALRQFLFLIFHKRFDWIYCCDADTLAGMWIYRGFRKSKVIYDSHELFTELPELAGYKWKKKIWRWVEQKGIALSDKRITVAHHLAQRLESMYNKTFEVIRNLPSRDGLGNATLKENIIIYQGVINKGRGLETAIDAMKSLPDYILWICGEGDVRLELEKRAKGMNNIIFFGLQEPEALKKITQRAKYGLNLLDLKSENYNLSLANKFFDYAASGVVSINSPGLEYIDYQYKYNNCFILNELDSHKLSKLIMDTSDQIFLEMQKNGYILLEENNWELESHKLLNYLKE